MNNPYFSIIVPVYKVEQYLEQCVQSILEQDCKDYELILVDDGSPDGSPAMCDRYAEIHDHVKVIHKVNGGLSDARNVGMAEAQGKYIIFIDSDDFWCCNDGLSSIQQKLDMTNADILLFGMKKYYQKDELYAEERIPSCDEVALSHADATKHMMEQNMFVASAWDKVVRRELITQNNMTFVKGQLSEDIEWCSKLLLCKPKIVALSKCIYVYRQQNSASITQNIGRRNLEHISGVIKRYTEIARQEKPENEQLLSFMAEQYVLWLTVSNLVKRKEIKDLLQEMKHHWFLTQYTLYPHVKLVGKVRILGFECVRIMLRLYSKIKRG